MKSNDLNLTLQQLGRHQRWCVTDATLHALYPAESRNTFHTALSRHVKRGVMKRLSPGIYLNPYASPPAMAAELLAGYLRPDDYAYLSLESALHEHGLISQVPNRLTFMTTGPSWTYTTLVGVIEFVHSQRDVATRRRRATFDRDRRIYVASPELALEDLTRVGRNLDLVDDETEN
jgi:predicted transcriptional regulator of viral defense system